MPVKLNLPLEKLSEDYLVDIYKLFCKAYEIGPTDYDEIYLRKNGLYLLKHRWGIDYKIYHGAEFFVQTTKDGISFYGYAKPIDPDFKSKDEKFQTLANEYFDKNRGDTI